MGETLFAMAPLYALCDRLHEGPEDRRREKERAPEGAIRGPQRIDRMKYCPCLSLAEARSRTKLGPRSRLRFDARERLCRRHRRSRLDLLRQWLAVHQELQLGRVQDFAVEQRLGDAFERPFVAVEDMARGIVGQRHDLANLRIDVNRGVFGIIAMLRNFAAKEDRFLFLSEGERSEFAHAPVAHHLSGDIRSSLDVVPRTRRDMAKENLFSRAAAH